MARHVRPEDPLQEDWRNLCLYLRDCVQNEVSSKTLKRSRNSYTVLKGQEWLITTETKSLRVDLPFIQGSGGRRTSVQYGWPMLVIQGASGRTALVPLFTLICDVKVASDGGLAALVPVTDPELNVALFSPQLLGPEVETDLDDLLGPEPDFTSSDFLSEVLPELGRMLDLPTNTFTGHLLPELPEEFGIHHVATVTQIEDSEATRDLISELEALAKVTDWTDTAAAGLLRKPSISEPPKRAKQSPIPVAPLQLNESQERALVRIARETVSSVTGPPGTGKSQIVVSAVADAWANDQTVLLASTNNAAVDVAVQRANELALGLLVRTGNKEAREQLPTLVTNILAAWPNRPDPLAVSQSAASLSTTYKRRDDLFNQLVGLERAEGELLEIVGQMHTSALRIWSEPEIHQEHFSNLTLASSAQWILRTPLLRRFRLRRLVRKITGVSSPIDIDAVRSWAKHCKSFGHASSKVTLLRERQIPTLSETLTRLNEAYTSSSLEFLRNIVNDKVASNKPGIRAAAGSGLGGRKNQDALRYAQAGIKGWACTALSMKRNFDLHANSFDLAVIDEASQCSLAYILPIAYRARRIAVVGDPNQLPPVVTLGTKAAANLAAKHDIIDLIRRIPGIDFVDGSAFHAFEDVNGFQQTQLLNEHFRCHPQIARWFNSVFYGDSLHVLTDISAMSSHQRGLAWVDVAGKAERPSLGKSWINKPEAEAAVALAAELMEEGLTIGVVSPFAAQAGLIQRMIESTLSRERLVASNLVVGTAHRLQGDERDAVILSCCVSPGIFPSSVKWIEDQRNLVNVAVSRAKQRLIVLGHPSVNAVGSPTLASLRAFAHEHHQDSIVPRRVDSHSESVLLDSMIRYGLDPLAKVETEGFELDFVVMFGKRKFDIEVDGDHHLDETGCLRRRDVARDRVLEAAGWEVLRFPAWRCWTEPDAVAAEIHTVTRTAASINQEW